MILINYILKPRNNNENKNVKPPKNPKTPKIIKRFKPKNPYFCQPCI